MVRYGQPMHPVVVAQSSVAGGAEAYLVRLYSSLMQQSVEPSLIGRLPGWADAGLLQKDIGLGSKWGSRTIASGMVRLPFERSSLRPHLVDRDADLYHVQFKREQIGFTDIMARTAPVLWTEHGRLPVGLKGRALGSAYRRAARKAAAIVCVSPVVADDVRRVVGGDVRVEVIENAVDTNVHCLATEPARMEARQQFGIPVDAQVLAWVGRLHPQKMPELAVQVGRAFDGYTLLAGGGAQEDVVRRAARDSRVLCLGHLNDPTPLFRAADAFLFTSTGAGEGLPTTLLESAAAGLPIVANSGAGMETFVGAAGGIVAPDTPEALLAGVEMAIAERASRGIAARAWAERHDLAAWVEAHRCLMREIVQRS